jgi:uncharacterized protein with HEPN domain
MPSRSAIARLTDILDAIENIRSTTKGVTLVAFEADWQKRWLVERGVEIISEASRHLPDELKEKYADIPWPRVAAIGNVLRHEYQRVAAAVLWQVAQGELDSLERACRAELKDEQGGG